MFGKVTAIDDAIEYNEVFFYHLMIELNISSILILLIASNK